MQQRNNPFYLIVLLAVFTTLGSFLYSYGFTSSATVSTNISQRGNPYISEMQFRDSAQRQIYQKQWFPTQSSQLTFLILDGLPYFFTVNEEEQKKKAELAKSGQHLNTAELKIPSQKVPFKEFLDRLNEEPYHSVLLKTYSHPPTYTNMRIKAMLSGIIPAYDQLTSNLGSKELKLDNIATQAVTNNPFLGEKREKVACYGIHFWEQLFPNTFQRYNFVPEVHFYRREQNDLIQIEHIFKEQLENDDWSSMFAHFDGIDEAGHISTRLDSSLEQLLKIESDLVKSILKNVQDSTVNTDQTIIIISDHGMNFGVKGHHGGYTDQETNTLMFGYSRHEFITQDKKDIGQNMDRDFLSAPDVFQINVTPTYCMLLGIPIPFDNLGMIVPDFFLDKPEIDDFVIANNFYTNFRQVEDNFSEKIKSFTVEIQSIKDLQELSVRIKQTYNSLFRKENEENTQVNEIGLKEFVQLCQRYSIEVVSAVTQDLQEPKLNYMSLGLLVHFATALLIPLVFFIIKALIIDAENQKQNFFSHIVSLLTRSKSLVAIFSLVSFVMFLILKFQNFMIFLGVFLLTVLTITFVLNSVALIQSLRYSCRTLFRSISIESVVDKAIFVASVTYYVLTRTSNDYFDRSTHYFTLYLNQVQIFFLVLLVYKIIRCQLKSPKKILINLIIIYIFPKLLQACLYYNVNADAQFQIPPPNYYDFIGNANYKYYWPMAIFLSFFIILLIAICWKVLKQSRAHVKIFFFYIHLVQLLSITIYYLCNWKIMDISHSITYFPAIALSHTLVLEICKALLYYKGWLKAVSKQLSIFYSLINVTIGFACILEWNCLIQLPIYFVLVGFICSFFIDMNSHQMITASSILFYVSQFFFQVSGHMEFLEEIHAEVFQIGVVFQSSVMISVFNGVINTLFYIIVTPIIYILFTYCIQAGEEKLRTQGMLSILFSQEQSINGDQDEEEVIIQPNIDIINELESGLDIFDEKQLVKKEIKHNGNYLSHICKQALHSLAFLSHSMIGIIGSDIRNIVKPFDSNKDIKYVPNYIFQIAFLLFYTLVFSYHLAILARQEKKQKEKIPELNIKLNEQL